MPLKTSCHHRPGALFCESRGTYTTGLLPHLFVIKGFIATQLHPDASNALLISHLLCWQILGSEFEAVIEWLQTQMDPISDSIICSTSTPQQAARRPNEARSQSAGQLVYTCLVKKSSLDIRSSHTRLRKPWDEVAGSHVWCAHGWHTLCIFSSLCSRIGNKLTEFCYLHSFVTRLLSAAICVALSATTFIHFLIVQWELKSSTGTWQLLCLDPALMSRVESVM